MAERHGLQQQHKQKQDASKCTKNMHIRKHDCVRARDDRCITSYQLLVRKISHVSFIFAACGRNLGA
eukprot:363080-Chlamydomonas_euryale.AAC.4